MGRRIACAWAAFLGLALVAGSLVTESADAEVVFDRDFRRHRVPATFQFLDAPLPGKGQLVDKSRVSLAGGSIAGIVGDRFAVLDGDRGDLIITDQAGKKLTSIAIGANASQLAVDNKRELIYVADRDGDQVHKISISRASRLSKLKRAETPAEPYGLALTPDGETLLVTTVADRTLVAYATKTMKKSWAIGIPAEARGVAISHDGKEAVIGHLTSGAISHVNLKSRALTHIALNQTGGVEKTIGFEVSKKQAELKKGQREVVIQTGHFRGLTANQPGRRFARNGFAVAILPNGVATVAYQESTPQQVGGGQQTGTYGGGFEAPINHRIAFVGRDKNLRGRRVARAEIAIHQPRALAYDSKADRLYVAAIGNDQLLAIGNATQPTAQVLWAKALPADKAIRCGPNGVTIGSDGAPRVFCSFTRRVVTVRDKEVKGTPTQTAVAGDVLTKSRLSKNAQLGRQIFHQGGDFRLSMHGAMACSSCHPEGRTDGLTWRIEGHSLQTPLLSGGRLMGTHPFKWDGKDADLVTSLTNTVTRLGGSGIAKPKVKQLTAFFATLEAPRTPTVDKKAIARGKKLFRSKVLGCESCHAGKRYTNNQSYPLANDLADVDTPSLIGLSASAPYYHDGSAADLRALLNGKGDVHGMGVEKIKPSQVSDLIAFLESL